MDMDTETYQLHQTPNDCAKDLIATLTLQNGDRVLEPFKGEGSFYNNFPNNTNDITYDFLNCFAHNDNEIIGYDDVKINHTIIIQKLKLLKNIYNHY